MNRSFILAVQQLIASSQISLFALVDGLQYERYTGQELQAENNTVLPLFDKYPDSRIAFAGTWLIDMQKQMRYREQLAELERTFPAVSWITSPATFADLVIHFRNHINILLPDGKVALLRFQDPRVQVRLGQILDHRQHLELTRIVQGWYVIVENHVYSLKERQFIC